MKQFSQRGIGLLELMLSLAIIALLLVMAMKFWGRASQSRQFVSITQDVALIVSKIAEFKGDGNYATISFQKLYEAGGIPDSIDSSGTTQQWDSCTGNVSITPTGTNNDQAQLQISNISQNLCGTLASRFEPAKNNRMVDQAQCTSGSNCSAQLSLTIN